MAFSPKSRTAAASEQAAARPSLEQEPVAPDALRIMVATIVQDVLKTEFDRFVGAAPYERSPERQAYRNGSYERVLKTRVGSLKLDVPRDALATQRGELAL